MQLASVRIAQAAFSAGELTDFPVLRRKAMNMTMIAQVMAKGFRADILRRILCFSLFWHALDIIWVGIFTVVYLYGVYL